jgi:hypothetical protein
MDDTQLIDAETIQSGDYGMLVDLKDAYLTLGLHPSHRKYCRFRHLVTGRRLQWRTEFDASSTSMTSSYYIRIASNLRGAWRWLSTYSSGKLV